MKVLSFKVWGKFAHFRKFWTTSSSLSYPFPPPTTVRGIIGAILGFSKREYIKKTAPLKVGIEILKPVRSTRISVNFLDTKRLGINYKSFVKNSTKSGILHTQTLLEVLINPEYRIYAASEDKELFNLLEETLKRGENHYTVSLGLANFLANFEYENTFECENLETTERVDTVIPVSLVENLDFEEDNLVGRDTIPVKLSEERKPISYESVIFSLSGKPLRGKFKNLLGCGDKRVFLF